MLSELSTSKLQQLLGKKEISVVEIVVAFTENIKKWNPLVNAVVENRIEQAIEEAHKKQSFLSSSLNKISVDDFFAEYPFFGIPFTIKEMIQVKGFKQTLGSVYRKDFISSADASVVASLKNAGGVLLGTTNVPEMGFWFECENRVYGRTSNPYDLTRTSGGSSGGEAAIVSCGGSAIGLGSDIGGSLRIPASFCGVFAHKPTNRSVPISGHYPMQMDSAHEFEDPQYPLTVIGPMANNPSDLIKALTVIGKPDNIDRYSRSLKYNLFQNQGVGLKNDPNIATSEDPFSATQSFNWSQLTIWTLPKPKMFGVPDCDEAIGFEINRTAKYFSDLGAKVEELDPYFFYWAVPLWFGAVKKVKGRMFHQEISGGTSINLTKHFWQTLHNTGNYTIPGYLTAALDKLSSSLTKDSNAFEKEMDEGLIKLRIKTCEILKNKNPEISNLLLMPVHPRQAPGHRKTYTRPFDYAYAGIMNALALPSTCVPVGYRDGLPIGVQVVGNMDHDSMTLYAAEALEKEFWNQRKRVSPVFPKFGS